MERRLFFNPQFLMDFDWKGKFQLRVGSVLPHNKQQISDGLRSLSPETIRNRFLGSKRDFSDKELEYLTILDGWNHYAIGVEERTETKRGVGIVRLVRSSHSETEAEIAITVIDERHHMGLGFFLMDLIILAAFERGIETLSLTYLPQNDAIIKLINRIGIPRTGPHGHDYHQQFIDLKSLDLNKIKSRLALTLPGIDTFDLKT